MGTTKGRRRNTSFDLAREEQEEDGCNGTGFGLKRVAKTRERGRSKEGGRQTAIIHIFAMEAC